MAEQMKLVRLNDFVSDVDTLDLLTPSAGIAVEWETWEPGWAEKGTVTEVMNLVVHGTSDDDLAVKMQAIEAKLWQVRKFIEATPEKYCVVLRDQAAGETNARQAMVTGFTVKPKAFHTIRSLVTGYQLALDRVAPWEASTPVTSQDFNLGAVGNLVITGEACGNMPANRSNLSHSLLYQPSNGCTVTLHYTDGTSQTATVVYSPLEMMLMNGGLVVGGIIGTSLTVWGESYGGYADPGSAVSIDYISGIGASIITLGGSTPGRIARARIEGISGGGTISEVWVGFRTARFGALANFVSPWEAELGTPGIETVAATDATATPGGAGNTRLLCTYTSHAEMCARMTLIAYQISSAHYADLRGTFDIIARVHVGSGVTALLRLDNGYLHGSTFVASQIGENVVVASEGWKYYNLGRITWPPLGRVSSVLNSMACACLQLSAERTAGSTINWLTIDHFVPIPVEGYAHFDALNVVFNVNNVNRRVEVYCDALGNVAGVQFLDNYPAAQVGTRGVQLDTWHLPAEAAMVVLAAQTASPALTDALTLVLEAFPRYLTMRGAG